MKELKELVYYPISKKWLKELEQLPFTENENYIRTLKEIPKHFESENLFFCMMLAFNFGEQRGKACERNKINWNAIACFQNMKFYAHKHNGELPKTYNDLYKFVEELEND